VYVHSVISFAVRVSNQTISQAGAGIRIAAVIFVLQTKTFEKKTNLTLNFSNSNTVGCWMGKGQGLSETITVTFLFNLNAIIWFFFFGFFHSKNFCAEFNLVLNE
jgi:hypothetical protein